MARLGGSVWLDVFAGYRACTLRGDGDDPLEAKLGGLSAGLGLAYRSDRGTLIHFSLPS